MIHTKGAKVHWRKERLRGRGWVGGGLTKKIALQRHSVMLEVWETNVLLQQDPALGQFCGCTPLDTKP